MSQQQYYEQVQRQQEFMSYWCQQFLLESGDDLYCPYCFERKGYTKECCDSTDFVPLRNLPLEVQMEVIAEEYHKAYGL